MEEAKEAEEETGHTWEADFACTEQNPPTQPQQLQQPPLLTWSGFSGELNNMPREVVDSFFPPSTPFGEAGEPTEGGNDSDKKIQGEEEESNRYLARLEHRLNMVTTKQTARPTTASNPYEENEEDLRVARELVKRRQLREAAQKDDEIGNEVAVADQETEDAMEGSAASKDKESAVAEAGNLAYIEEDERDYAEDVPMLLAWRREEHEEEELANNIIMEKNNNSQTNNNRTLLTSPSLGAGRSALRRVEIGGQGDPVEVNEVEQVHISLKDVLNTHGAEDGQLAELGWDLDEPNGASNSRQYCCRCILC